MNDRKREFEQRIDSLSVSAKTLLAMRYEKIRLAESPLPQQLEAKGRQRLLAYVVGEGVDNDSLLSLLQSRLPEYMVPRTLNVVEKLPRTAAGKLDRQALLAIESAAIEQNASQLVAPRNETEEILATIWGSVLGLDELSVHDNFFEVGGDSLLSIRILARARQQGLQISPERFFSHPTIAQQAKIAGEPTTVIAESGQIKGTVPLTPIQHWFFDRILVEQQQWNQSMLFSIPETLDSTIVERAWQSVLLHHDALRMRYRCVDQQWQQEIIDLSVNLPFVIHDFSKQSLAECNQAIEDLAIEMNTSLKLSNGLLLRLAFVQTAPGHRNQVLLLAHHLIIDALSWRLLLDDFELLCKQIQGGERIQLAAKTSSFKAWSRRLFEYAQSEPVAQEFEYWNQGWPANAADIPVDFESEPQANRVGTVAHVQTVLEDSETLALLHDVPKAYNTQINDALLTALALVISDWTRRDCVLVDLEGHGREALFETLDISRTIAWFTTVFPVLLQPGDENNLGGALVHIKEQLRLIPSRGIGHGLLRYLTEDENIRQALANKPLAGICFNYLGQIQQSGQLFRLEQENCGPARSMQGNRAYLLEVNVRVAKGQLHVDWSYSEQFHRHETIEHLALNFMQTLRNLIQHCISPEAGGFTPSDFPLAELEQAELDTLLGLLDQVDEPDRTG